MSDFARVAVILLVEDDPLLRMATADDLITAGFRVIEASDADQAILILESGIDIQAVFTDIDMPGSMNGLRLAAAVRDRWPPVKLIVTSGHWEPREDELPEGVPFLRKPYAASALVSSVEGLFR
ncbi:response regulator [Mesorhizobium sp. BR1-1-16]|uniref:response regulator n=1 Tax=Mesorhizobium sp. BR1-1-16 TaxID=2876653 RepID=UPI001CD00C98|nr:response regulator [Mesorhizobium sp. BR1-1-16]MBZ9936932.1 response regulator [Mesorhizobium sp. BR1-1-16]